MIFVIGTKPGVGKTLVAMTLLRLAGELGVRAAGMKPVQTGCPYTEDHDLWSRDGDVLRAASRHPLPPLVTSPYRFSAPGSPLEAARRAGMTLRLADLVKVVETARDATDLLIVEGTGDASTAIAEDGTTADLAIATGGRIVLVADGEDEPNLSYPPGIAGVIVTRAQPRSAPHVLATIPPLGDGDDALDALRSAGLGATLIRPSVSGSVDG